MKRSCVSGSLGAYLFYKGRASDASLRGGQGRIVVLPGTA